MGIQARFLIASFEIAYPDGEGKKIAESERVVSVFNAVGPPVPIPNTEVKRCSGENTWLATAREDSSTLTQKNSSGRSLSESVILTQWVHPFPFRTRKLSAAVVKILGWRRPGKIAHSRHNQGKLNKFPLISFIRPAKTAEGNQTSYSSLAQSVEHLTVNQGVAGSSPAGGARKKALAKASAFFQRNKSLAGFVKCTSCVKYGFAM